MKQPFPEGIRCWWNKQLKHLFFKKDMIRQIQDLTVDTFALGRTGNGTKLALQWAR